MNIEIANRLLQLRKEHNLSQETLAAKLNISRQAVSKWERAEAAPDTDKLVDLAKLYGISVDELLTGKPKANNAQGSAQQAEQTKQADNENNSEKSYSTNIPKSDSVSFKNGIHVHSSNGDKVDIGLNGIHVDGQNGEKVHVGLDGIYVDDSKNNVHKSFRIGHNRAYKMLYAFPYPLIAILAFFFSGMANNVGYNSLSGWSVAWVWFLTIPLYYTTILAAELKNPLIFCYPVVCVIVYAFLGFFANMWHPGWIIFVTIPFYYWVAALIYKEKRHQRINAQNNAANGKSTNGFTDQL